MTKDILVTTTNFIPDYEVAEVLGIVKGSTVRAKWFGKDILAGLRNIVGGEIKEYTEMMEDSRKQATERMIENAQKLNADAILEIRFASSQMMQSAAEILVYGTAVKLVKKKK